MARAKVQVCLNSSCSSLGAMSLIRDMEEIAGGQCDVEEWGCLGKCGKGPNIEVKKPGQSKVYEGVKKYAKAKEILEKEGCSVGSTAKKFGKIKWEIRRDEDAGNRLAKIESSLNLLGGEDAMAKSEPTILSEMLVLRSKEHLKTQASKALKDAEHACQLAPKSCQAKLAVANAYEALAMPTAGVAALKEVLELGSGINKGTVNRQITRLTRKIASMEAEGVKEGPALVEAAPEPAPAPKAKPKPAPKKEGDKKAAAKAKSKGKTDDKKASDKKTADKKDKKEKDKAKEKEKEALPPIQRSPMDMLDWKLESVETLNHNCILMKLKSLSSDVTSRDADPGGVWHVDFVDDQSEPGVELKRSYTPVSNFKTYLEGSLEFMIKVYPDGKMTQYLAKLAAGDNLLVSAPYNTENLEGCKDVIMVAGGSAVTVAIQICEEALRLNPQDVAVQLMMCNHAFEDILYQDVFDRLLEKYPSFRLVHCISGDVPDEHKAKNSRVEWSGRLSKEVIQIPNPNTRCYASGPRGLMKAVTDVWKSLEQPEECLHVLDEMSSPADDIENDSEVGGESAAPEASTEAAAGSTEAPDSIKAQPEAVAAPAEATEPEKATAQADDTDGVPAISVSAPEKTPEGTPGLFASFFRPFMCGACKAPANDGEDVPGVRMDAVPVE